MNFSINPGFQGCIFLSIIPILIVAVVFLVRRKNPWGHFFGAVLAVYLLFAASATLFPIYVDSDRRQSAVEIGWKLANSIRLVPFQSGFGLENILNIVLTFPLGFLLPLVRRRTTWKAALFAGLSFGFGVELYQLLLALLQGFSTRIVDTADLICNLLGAMLGYLAVCCVIAIVKKLFTGEHGENSLIAYLNGRSLK